MNDFLLRLFLATKLQKEWHGREEVSHLTFICLPWNDGPKKGLSKLETLSLSPPSFVKAIVVGMRRNHVWLEVFNGARRNTRKIESVGSQILINFSWHHSTCLNLFTTRTHMPRPSNHVAWKKITWDFSTRRFAFIKVFPVPPLKRKNNYNLFRWNLPGRRNNTHPAEIQS